MFNKKAAVLLSALIIASNAGYLSSACNMIYAEDTVAQVTDEQKDTFSVSYDLNGGTGKIDQNEPAAAGDEVKLSVWALKLDGYAHTGWTDGTNTYERGETILMPDHDLTLKAVYKKLYTLSYEDLSYTGQDIPLCDQTVVPGTEIHLQNYALHYKDAMLEGWYVNDVLYKSNGTFIMPEEDVHVRPYWLDPINWSFSSGVNDKYCSPDLSYQRYPGKPTNLPDGNRLSRVGYKLTGWYDKENDIKYSLEAPVVIPDKDIVYYAIWTPVKISVRFDANGGTGEMSKMIQIFGENFDIPECTFVKDGYKLLAWKCYDQYFYPEENVKAHIEEFGDSMQCSACWIEDSINPGDIDANGVSDMSDLTMLSQYLIGDVKLDETQEVNADVVRNKKVDLADLASFKQYIMNEHIILGLEAED